MPNDMLRLIGRMEMDVNKKPDRVILIDKLMGEILDVEPTLNAWEREFIHDMTLRFSKDDYDITDRQLEMISKIHKRRA